MVTIAASTLFGFRVIDCYTSDTGYMLKVSNPPLAGKAYNFLYVPYGQYSSLMMLDYLLATRIEIPSILEQQLISAVREDVTKLGSGMLVLEASKNLVSGIIGSDFLATHSHNADNLETLEAISELLKSHRLDGMAALKQLLDGSSESLIAANVVAHDTYFSDAILSAAMDRAETIFDSGIFADLGENKVFSFTINEAIRPNESPALLNESTSASPEAYDTSLNQGTAAASEAKPSYVDTGQTGKLDLNPSYMNELDVGEKEKLSHITTSDLAERSPERQAYGGENSLTAIRPVQQDAKIIDATTAAINPDDVQLINDVTAAADPKDSDVINGEEANPEKPAHMEAVQAGIRPVDHDAENNHPALIADKSEKESYRNIDLMAKLQSDLTYYANQFILGSSNNERSSAIADIYFTGVNAAKDGLIADAANYATLFLREGMISEDNLGKAVDTKTVLALDILLGIRDNVSDGVIGSSDTAQKESAAVHEIQGVIASEKIHEALAMEDETASLAPSPGTIISGISAQKSAEYVAIVEGIIGDRDLAEGIIAQYLNAKKELSEASLVELPTGVRTSSQDATLDKVVALAQSFVYNYDSDILESGMDPEYWDGGFGVPADYNPLDPFNKYYPWTDDKNTRELSNDDWIRFWADASNQGLWSRDKDKGEFTCSSGSSDVSGYYRNDFNTNNYTFEIDFIVQDGSGDKGTGIVFNLTDDRNYYMFMINGGDASGSLGMPQPMQLYKVTNGVPSRYASPMNPFTWRVGEWHRIKVTVLGNRIKLQVDGRLQYDFTE